MATQPSFNNQNIDFLRLAVLDTTTRPQPALVLYPQNSDGTTLSVNVTSTTISIRYISSSTQTETINYVGKFVEDLALTINSLTLPIKAVPCLRNHILGPSDIFLDNTSSYFSIPSAFKVFDRTYDNGIFIRSNKFTVSHNKNVNFKLLPPYGKTIFEPWYPLISNGEFSYKEAGKFYKYAIPEFGHQVWSTKFGRPFKDVIDGSLTYVRQNTFKVSRTPIFWAGDNIRLYNNTTFISSSIIEDIDVENGLIYFKPNTVISDQTRIDYTYIEKNFEYTDINLNSHITQNPQLLDKFVILYAIPLEGLDYAINKKTIYHVIADSAEDAESSIERINKDVPIVVIGGYNIQQVYTSDRISILDTRSLGGGLIDRDGSKSPLYSVDTILENRENKGKIEDSIVEKQSFFDIGNYDGSAYPGAGSVVVELPLSLKDKLSEKDIKEKATKFLAAGIYSIISYYDEDLPAISGASTQMSLLLNGGLIESFNNVTGNCWARFPVNPPGHVTTGTWTTGDENFSPSISKVDNTGVVSTSALFGTFQSYLKSSPIAGIEYYTRTLTASLDPEGDSYSYTPWTRIRVEDDRDVPDYQLIKGYVSFPTSLNNTEYRSIKVHSPFRLDQTGQLKSYIKNEIYSIDEKITSRTTGLDITSPYAGEVTISPIVSRYSDITTLEKTPYNDYIGIDHSQNYIYELIKTDLSGEFRETYENIGHQIIESLGNASYTGRIKFFSVPLLQYKDYSIDSYNLDIASVIRSTTDYGDYRKRVYGLSDPYYTGIKDKVRHILSEHVLTEPGRRYLPKSYNYFAEITGILISGNFHAYPEQSGYSPAEIVEGNNSDFEYLYALPAIVSATRLIDSFSGSYASMLSPWQATAWSGATEAISRINNAINGTRTNNGFPVVQHWYNPYNRYGKLAGSMCRQLIDSYNYLFDAQSVPFATGGLSWSGTPGMDIRVLESGFKYIESTLFTASTGFYETLVRGGILDDYTADLLYGYAWYVNNRTRHIEHISPYLVVGAPLASIYPQNSEYFSGIFMTGLSILIKGMVTVNGDILETTIVDGNQGPFDIKTPSKIIDTLAEACKLDKSYIPVTQAVVTTIKNNYSTGGLYYLDPLKSVPYAGHEDIISSPLARLYGAL